MWKFKMSIEAKYKVQFKDYHELHRWSVENVAEFWEEAWYYTNISSELDGVTKAPFKQVSQDGVFNCSE